MAFSDDLCIITSPAGARAALDEVAGTVAAHCGIASNLGKTRAIAAEAIPAPPGKPEAQRGVVVLGTPLGHPAFVQAWAEDRMRLERQLLDRPPAAFTGFAMRLVVAADVRLPPRQPRYPDVASVRVRSIRANARRCHLGHAA